VHVLDTGAAFPLVGKRAMKTGRWRWLAPPAEGSPAWLDTSLIAAQAAVRRAHRAVGNVLSHFPAPPQCSYLSKL